MKDGFYVIINDNYDNLHIFNNGNNILYTFMKSIGYENIYIIILK
jgi:hypothetical protein